MFEPMKAYTQNPTDMWLQGAFMSGVVFYVTDKFDGIRCVITDKGAVSRTLKPIPNNHVRKWLEDNVPIGFDGELMTAGVFGDCQSHFMSHDVIGDFTYHVFDDFTNSGHNYKERVERLKCFCATPSTAKHVQIELPRRVNTFAMLQKEEEAALERGREGLILRVPWGPYKFGRSTLSEGYMLKLKRWEDAEATIIGFVPLMRNHNPATINAFGRQERKHGINLKVPDEMLGAWVVDSEEFGVFNLGGPYTALQRCKFYEDREQMMGKKVTYLFQRHGTQAKPRNPKFHRIRLD